MDHEVKRLIRDHIWKREYKEAVAIIDEFKEDPDAKELLDLVDKMMLRDQEEHAAKGMHSDKSTYRKEVHRVRYQERWWKDNWFTPIAVMAAFLFLATKADVATVLVFLAGYWILNRKHGPTPLRIFLGVVWACILIASYYG